MLKVVAVLAIVYFLYKFFTDPVGLGKGLGDMFEVFGKFGEGASDGKEVRVE